MNENSHINWVSVKTGISDGTKDIEMLSAKTGIAKEFFMPQHEFEDFQDASDYIMQVQIEHDKQQSSGDD